MAFRKISTLTEQLGNKQKQPRKSKKVEARSVTAPHLKEIFQKEQAECLQKEQEELSRQAQKKADDEKRMAQIEHDIRTRIFDCPLVTFLKRKKDDIITLAGALNLSREGTCEDLRHRIMEHPGILSKSLSDDPRFAGLFSTTRRARQQADQYDRDNDTTNTNTQPPTQNNPTMNPQEFHQPLLLNSEYYYFPQLR